MRHALQGRTGTVLAGALLLLVTACGGDSDSGGSDKSANDSASESNATDQDEAEDSTSASLHESLADFPLPPGSEVSFPASEYDDERHTVAQFVSVPMTHLEVAAYLFEQMPAAGYTVVDKSPGYATSLEEIDPEFGGAIYFENPDGVPGQVTLQVQGDKTGLNFNVYTAGDA